MYTFELRVWYDETSRCAFYTVQRDGSVDSETDAFFAKYEDEEAEWHDESNQLLYLILEKIGNTYGATNDFFNRPENRAQALPPKPGSRLPEIVALGFNFPLRLYCYRISPSLVVLYNGGFKDAPSAQESKDLSMKFYDAQQFTKKIQEALREGMIIVSDDGRRLTDYNGNEEIIL